MFDFNTSDSPEFTLAPAGTHKAFIDDVEVFNKADGKDKLIFKFDLVDLDVMHNEFVTPSIMEGDGFRVFADLFGLVNPNGLPTEGKDQDEKMFVGVDCMITIVHREGTGKHAGKTFANVTMVEAIPAKVTAVDPATPTQGNPFPAEDKKKA